MRKEVYEKGRLVAGLGVCLMKFRREKGQSEST